MASGATGKSGAFAPTLAVEVCNCAAGTSRRRLLLAVFPWLAFDKSILHATLRFHALRIWIVSLASGVSGVIALAHAMV